MSLGVLTGAAMFITTCIVGAVVVVNDGVKCRGAAVRDVMALAITLLVVGFNLGSGEVDKKKCVKGERQLEAERIAAGRAGEVLNSMAGGLSSSGDMGGQQRQSSMDEQPHASAPHSTTEAPMSREETDSKS
ncbi:hypothetical protein ACHAWO_001972 [Cyclotella atomus]|uniref:Uncharacterized protein n=1 Tax=Cyclotella atomus TaxID=382360 RepID=A0ABD3MLR8_9STRA